MFLADFHVHTNWSDGKHALNDIVDFYGELGFGAIAVTDHICEQGSFLGNAARWLGQSVWRYSFDKYIDAIKEEAERARKLYGMILLPGFEISQNHIFNSRSAHMIGLGLETWVNPDLDALEVARAIRAAGGLAIAAHPVSTRKFEKQTFHLWNRREELRSSFDAWEVASGPHIFDEVLQSNLPKIASSDLHHKKQINSWKTVLECERHPEAIMDAIRRQDLSFRFFEAPAPALMLASAERSPKLLDLRGRYSQRGPLRNV